MCWVVSLSLRPSTFKGDNMKKDDRGDQDLTKQIEIKNKEIETLNDVVINLKNIIDSKEAEITARESVSESHKKLAKQIEDLEIQAKEMLAYP